MDMTLLHPQAAAVLAAAGAPLVAASAVHSARDALRASTPADCGPVLPVAEVTDTVLAGVPVRVYRPSAEARPPVALYFHGGGWVIGDLDTVDAVCRRLAVYSGCAVVSVDYRLAPEHRWPAPIDDAAAVLGAVRGTGAETGFDPRRVALAGDSAGGHLAAVLAARARDEGSPVQFMALAYPALDPDLSSASYQECDGLALPKAEMAFFWSALAGGPVDPADRAIRPLLAELDGMPPTLVVTAEHDVLRDEAEAYARALAAHGVPCVAIRYQGMVHGFFRRFARYDAADSAVRHVAVSIAGALRTDRDAPAAPAEHVDGPARKAAG
jgi:acetyl esterase